MADVAFVKSLGDIRLEDAQPLTALRDLAAEAQYASGATNHETLMQLHGLAAEALHNSGATAHDTSGFSVNSPYVCPEEGTGVITDYSV